MVTTIVRLEFATNLRLWWPLNGEWYKMPNIECSKEDNNNNKWQIRCLYYILKNYETYHSKLDALVN